MRPTSTIISEIEQHYLSTRPLDRGCKNTGCPNKSRTGKCIRCLTNELDQLDRCGGRAKAFTNHMAKAHSFKRRLLELSQ